MAQSNKVVSDLLKLKENAERKDYAKMRKHVLEHFQTKEYDKVKHLLSVHKEKVEEFFSQEGRCLVRWAVVSSVDPESLFFLFQNMPTPVLQKILSDDGFYIVKSLLQAEAGIEGEDSPSHRSKYQEIQIERFKLLLSIDAQGVEKFMQESASERFCTEKIKSNFATALQQHKTKKFTHK